MKGTVLIVDDTEFYRKVYMTKLLSAGYVTRVATNGLEALKSMMTQKPDLILLDLVMPEMDGFKVLQAVRASPALHKIPVIVFSSKGVPEEIQKALQAGANDFLIKSTTTPNKVIEKIDAYIKK